MTESGKKAASDRSLTAGQFLVPAAIALAYLLTARLSLLLAPENSNATAVWPPSGIALGCMLIYGYRAAPGIFAGAFLANVLALGDMGFDPGRSITVSLVTAAGNMSEGIVGAWLIRRFTGTTNPFENIRHLFVFIVYGCLLGTTLSATTGVTGFCSMSGEWSRFFQLWLTWWLGDAAGIIITAPLVVLLAKSPRSPDRERRNVEAFTVFLVLIASVVLIFSSTRHLEYWIIPPILWIALRLGRLESSSAVFIVAAIAVVSTVRGAGPMAGGPLHESLLYLQSFISVMAVIALSLSVMTHERAVAEEERSETSKQLYDIIEFLPDATFAIDGGGRVIAWNRAAEKMTGVPRRTIIGRGDYAYAEPFFGERHPILIDLLDLPSKELESRYKYVRRDGNMVQAESFIARLRGGLGAHLWGIAAPLYDREGRRTGAIEVIRDVTEQKHVEQALRESETLHRTLFESASDAILLMSDNRFIDCNARTLEMFGSERDQVVGASPLEFSPPLQPDGAPSEARAMERIQAALAGNPQFFEWTHCRRDGTPFTAEVSLNAVILDGKMIVQAIVRDITGRKKTQEALRESERKYRELVELANSIILRWTRDGTITYLNEFGQRFFGYDSREIIGRHVVGTIVPRNDSAGADLELMMERICADPAAFENNINENMRRDGRRVWVAWTNRIVMDPHGRVSEILSVGTDITDLKSAEDEIRELNAGLERRVAERTAELAAARDQAEAADRIKSAFLATMSHELRTPLNSIIGFTGIILQELAGPLNDEQARQMGMVRNSAQHLLSLINDVLDISKIEAGQLTVAREPFDIREALEKSVAAMRPLADRKGLLLDSDIPDVFPEALGDQRRVEQVLLNLLSNAIKYTEKGSVSITASLLPGHPSSGGDSCPAVAIRVADTGIGIREDDLQKLFQPFRQVDTGLARKSEGTGLGLAICRRLAGLMGGEVSAESRWGRGSTFTFILPLGGLNP